MPGLLAPATTFTSTNVHAAGGTQVASYTAVVGGFVVPSGRLSGLNTTARQTLTLYQILNDATSDHPGSRGSRIKAASADTRIELMGDPVWLDAGDMLKVRVESSSAGDTAIGGSVRFLDAGNPTGAVGLDIASRAALTADISVSLTTGQLGTAAEDAKTAAESADLKLDEVASQASVAALGSPMQAAGYTAPDNAGVAAIRERTANLPNLPAAAGDAMALTPATVTGLVSAVWSATGRTLTGFGSLVSEVWGHATRTLTSADTIHNWIITETAASPAASPAKIAVTRGVAYDVDHANAFHWASAAWPSLVGATVTFTATSRQTGDVDLNAVSCVLLANTVVRLSLTADQTSTLDLGDVAYRWTLDATLADATAIVLAQGYIEVSES